MQPCFAAIAARPFRLRADQAHTGAAGVVMDFPVSGKKLLDICVGKKIWCPVRAVQDTDLPVIGIGRNQFLRQGAAGMALCCPDVQDVAVTQGASGMSAEESECEGGFAAEIRWYLKSSLHGQIGAAAVGLDSPELEQRTGLDCMRLPLGQWLAVQAHLDGGTGYGNHAVAVEPKGRADHSDFESGLVFGIVHQTVGQTEGQTVHRSGWRYPDMPVA